eukprot:7479405-Prorocentrum_lima.AAC.1
MAQTPGSGQSSWASRRIPLAPAIAAAPGWAVGGSQVVTKALHPLPDGWVGVAMGTCGRWWHRR